MIGRIPKKDFLSLRQHPSTPNNNRRERRERDKSDRKPKKLLQFDIAIIVWLLFCCVGLLLLLLSLKKRKEEEKMVKNASLAQFKVLLRKNFILYVSNNNTILKLRITRLGVCVLVVVGCLLYSIGFVCLFVSLD